MLKVLKPSKNRITQGYSSGHKGYDHSGRGDLNYYSSIYGKVVQAKNSETKNWTNTGKLTNADYGNRIEIKGLLNGKVATQLGAHFEFGSVLKKGKEVKAGQVVAKIGNTGNSTARHSHTEYRDSGNKNFPVEFVDTIEDEKKDLPMDAQSKEQIIIDSYKATTGEYPSDDEKAARLQKNENTTELIYDLLRGDSRSKPRWLEIWEVEKPDTTLKETLESYKDSFHKLKELLKLPLGDNTEDVLGAVAGILERNRELEEAQEPKARIFIAEKELSYFNFFRLFIGIFKK